MFTLDTNILIPSLINGSKESKWLHNRLKKEEMIFCPIVISEYLVKASTTERTQLEKLLDFYRVMEIDYCICRQTAEYRKKYHKKTKLVYLMDCFIAACAKEYKATLITYNTSDYPMKDINVTSPTS